MGLKRTRDQKSTCTFVQYRPWIPGGLRRGTCAVECVAAHLRGFEEVSRLEVVFCIVEWSFEFGYHWLMLLMFLTTHLFQFRFVDSEQYCNMALRLRCRRHEFSVVRLLSPACHLFSCELWYATDDFYFVPMELDVNVAVLLGTRRRRKRRAGFQSIVNLPPPPTSSRTRIVQYVSTHRYIHIRPEVVGWAPPV